MVVHEMRSFQQLLKVVKSNIQSNGHSNGRPERIPSADPIPELEHVGLIDAEFLHFGRVGRQGNEVLGYGAGLEKIKAEI